MWGVGVVKVVGAGGEDYWCGALFVGREEGD